MYTTIYPGVERFLPEWSASVRAQTDRDFDLWVGLDGVTAEEASRHLENGREVHWSPSRPGDTPATVRERAIAEIVRGYDAVIFVDSDDVLLPERVAAARRALERSDVAGCSLRVVDEGGRDTGVVFGVAPDTDWDAFLPRYNVFGMSNTAYRTEFLERALPVPPAGRLVDWLLVTRAWWSGARLSFHDVPAMQYRQYSDNVARVLPPFAPSDIRSAAERVASHYAGLLDVETGVPADRRPRFEAERERVERFRRMCAVPGRLEAYARALNALPAASFWWWCVAHPDLEGLWAQ